VKTRRRVWAAFARVDFAKTGRTALRCRITCCSGRGLQPHLSTAAAHAPGRCCIGTQRLRGFLLFCRQVLTAALAPSAAGTASLLWRCGCVLVHLLDISRNDRRLWAGTVDAMPGGRTLAAGFSGGLRVPANYLPSFCLPPATTTALYSFPSFPISSLPAPVHHYSYLLFSPILPSPLVVGRFGCMAGAAHAGLCGQDLSTNLSLPHCFFH